MTPTAAIAAAPSAMHESNDPVVATEGDVTDDGLSRRNLLKGTAAAAAVGSLSLACATPGKEGAPAAAAMSGPTGTLKVGLVGCGGRGIGAAYNSLRVENGTVRLTAVADLFPERVTSGLERLAGSVGEERSDRIRVDEDHRFVGFDAYQKLIDSDVDVVLLATPPAFRPQHLAYAIEKDKHVFCEKPIAIDAPGVRSVLDTAERARTKGLSIVSGFCWRYNVRHQALYQRIHDGDVGALRAVYATYNASPIGTHSRQDGWSDREWMLRNWHHFYELSGDHIVEQAVHSLDKIAWAFGDVPPERVVAGGGCQTRKGPEKGNTFDHFNASFDYADGAKAFLMCRQMANAATENNDYIMGSRGVAEIQGWTPLHKIEGRTNWIYEGEGNDMYQQEHDDLFAGIRAGTPINDGVWMSHSTMLGIMARMSAYTGRVITWDEALASEENLVPDAWSLGAAEARPMAVPGETPFV